MLGSNLLWRMVSIDGLRLAGGLAGIVAGIWILAEQQGAIVSALLMMLWLATLYIGGKWRDFWRFHRLGPPPTNYQGPSWTIAFWAANAVPAALWLVLGVSGKAAPLSTLIDALGVSTNLAYAGAKAGCAAIGCCGAYRTVPWFRSSVRATLPIIEVVMSLAIGIVALGACTLYPGIAGAMALAAHGLLRTLEYLVRFPYRRLRRQISDPASAAILLTFGSVAAALVSARLAG